MFTDAEFQKFGRFVLLADALSNPGRYFQDDVDLAGLTLRVPATIKARLEEYSDASGKSMQFICRELIEQGLDQLDEVCIGLQEYREEQRAIYEMTPCHDFDDVERLKAEQRAKALAAVKAMKGGKS